MLNLINDYLRLGLESGAAPDASPWPLVLATALIAATILTRRSDE